MRLVTLRSTQSKKPDGNSTSDALSPENSRLDGIGPKPTDLAYAAGYIDGEGCFRWAGTPRVSVKTTYPHVLEWLKHTFGGVVNQATNGDGVSRSAFEWNVYGKKATAVCALLLPYLKEKREQASILMQIAEFPPNSEARRRRVESLSKLKRIDYGI